MKNYLSRSNENLIFNSMPLCIFSTNCIIILNLFSKIHTVDDLWTWANNVFSVQIVANNWYNNQTVQGQGGFIDDYSSIVVSSVVLRQVRVKDSKF